MTQGLLCSACGTENAEGQRFRGECGTALGASAATAASAAIESVERVEAAVAGREVGAAA